LYLFQKIINYSQNVHVETRNVQLFAFFFFCYFSKLFSCSILTESLFILWLEIKGPWEFEVKHVMSEVSFWQNLPKFKKLLYQLLGFLIGYTPTPPLHLPLSYPRGRFIPRNEETTGVGIGVYHVSFLKSSNRCVFKEGFWGSKPLPFFGFFLSLLGFFKKKPQPPLYFPFHIKIFQNPSFEKFLDTPFGSKVNNFCYTYFSMCQLPDKWESQKYFSMKITNFLFGRKP